MATINIGKGEYKFCPICGRSRGAFCFVNDEVYYDKQKTVRDPDGRIVACYRSKNAEKMATSGTSFVSLDEPGDCSLAISGVDGSQWAFIYEQKGADYSSGYVWCFFQDINSYRRKQAFWEEKMKGKTGGKKTYRREFVPAPQTEITRKEPETAGTARLHEVYSCLLDLLKVEDWTEKSLKNKDKWDDEMYDYLVNTYKIRTLPPADKDRFGDNRAIFSRLYSKSPTRKAVMERLIEKVGVPEGVPGFQKHVSEEGEKWYLTGSEGMLIPVYDPKGYIVRLRIRLSEETLDEQGRIAYEDKIQSFIDSVINGFDVINRLYVKHCGDLEECKLELAFGEDYEDVVRPEDPAGAARYDERLQAAEARLEKLDRDYSLFHRFTEGTNGDTEKQYLNAKRYFLAENFGGDEKKALKYYRSKGGKYKWVSSNEKYGGTPSRTVLGFYGLEWLESYTSGEETRIVVTEGEKKGMVAAYNLGYIFVTLPGVAQYSLLAEQRIESLGGKTAFEWFKDIGVKSVAVANDADMLTNANVYEATKGLCQMILEKGFKCEMVQWSETGGKGIDDACMSGDTIEFLEITM